ncbi:class E sortase [Actinosynnema pretiosum]|uniref:class E sortase n=1 Tax=Actinosynnema pretiosum TaxID=42197 RepID=UPI002811727B|nr:class E sortase [Actinosynnema pretiosum]
MSFDPPATRGGPSGQPPHAQRPRPYPAPQASGGGPGGPPTPPQGGGWSAQQPTTQVARQPQGPRPAPRGPRHSQQRPPQDEATQVLRPVGDAPTQYAHPVGHSLPPPPGRPVAPPRHRAPRRPVEPPTEVIPRFEDDRDDYEDPQDDLDRDERAEADRHEPEYPPEGPLRKVVRGTGEALITLGLVVLLFVVYEVYVTDLISAGKQDDVTSALDEEWKDSNTVAADPQREVKYDLLDGKAFAKIYIPVFGADYKFSIVEGTTDKDLETGPGHYKGTALPGEKGNFAVAGHRVGKGSPFNDLDLLNSCDAIVVETQASWFVYRMLPKNSEVAGWASRASDPRCKDVGPLSGPYSKTQGQEIVLPSAGEVINEVPYNEAQVPEDQLKSLMTLTTCHPRFSDKQRLIVHATLAQHYPKSDGFLPPELKEQ